MKKDNVIQIKSYAFAVRIVNVYQYLCEDKREFTLSKQLLRSGNFNRSQYRRSNRWTNG
jgi:hypothetical protein